MKSLFFFIASIISPALLHAQSGSGISFPVTSYNFGIIQEDGGNKYYDFEFQNLSESPLIIREIRSSCGCTKAEYDRRTIEKGEKGIIRAGYDPIGRPGDFLRMLIVCYQHKTAQDTLFIEGFVEKSTLERCSGFRYRHGDLCLKRKQVTLQNFNPDKPREESILVRNASSRQSFSLRFIGLSDRFHLSLIPDVLLPGEEGELIIRYQPHHKESDQTESSYEVWQISEQQEQNLFDLKIRMETPEKK